MSDEFLNMSLVKACQLSKTQHQRDAYHELVTTLEELNFISPKDKAFISYNFGKNPANVGLISIYDTEHGKQLESVIKSQDLNIKEADTLRQAATQAYINQASGNITLDLDPSLPNSYFKSFDLPLILENRQISSINSIDKKHFEVALLNDRSKFKDTTNQNIVEVISGKRSLNDLFNKKLTVPEAQDVLTQAVRLYLGDDLERAQNDLKSVRTNLNSLHEDIRITKTTGHKHKSHLKIKALTILGDYKSALNLFSELRTRASTPEALRGIKNIADSIAQHRKYSVSNQALTNIALSEIDRSKSQSLNGVENEKLGCKQSLSSHVGGRKF